MATTHGLPDTLYETQAIWGDLGPEVIIAHSGLSVPVSSLTLPAVAASGYVKVVGPPLRMAYVSQPAASLTFPGNGTYWLALHTDLSTAASGWTRRAGTHYVWQQNATQPPGQTQLLGFAQITVAGGVITAVTLLPNAVSPPLSQQNSNAVAITGGSAALGGANTGVAPLAVRANTAASDYSFLWPAVRLYPHTSAAGAEVNGLRIEEPVVSGGGTVGSYRGIQLGDTTTTGPSIGLLVNISNGANRYAVNCTGTAPSYFGGTVQMATKLAVGTGGTDTNTKVRIAFDKSLEYGLIFQQLVNDAGAGVPVRFQNVAGADVGSITTTGSATAYNTSSDVRLKTAITPLTAALERIRALRPVQFLWKSDDSPGVGFIAHEVQEVLDGVITGEADAVDDAGQIVPQQIDHSKLVPWLTAALKETLAQVEALTARVAALEAAQA